MPSTAAHGAVRAGDDLQALRSFYGSATAPHGAEPNAGSIAIGTARYGTIDYGGASGNRTVFHPTPAGTESVGASGGGTAFVGRR